MKKELLAFCLAGAVFLAGGAAFSAVERARSDSGAEGRLLAVDVTGDGRVECEVMGLRAEARLPELSAGEARRLALLLPAPLRLPAALCLFCGELNSSGNAAPPA